MSVCREIWRLEYMVQVADNKKKQSWTYLSNSGSKLQVFLLLWGEKKNYNMTF